MKSLNLILALICLNFVSAQVGIGVTNPKAQLHINATDNGMPALRLAPQKKPTGTSSGQIAVIGDNLYMYDATRGKWLSVEATKYSFGLEDGADNQSLEYNGDIEKSGPLLPKDGTIVYIAMNSSGGEANKGVQLQIGGVDVPNNTNPNIDGLINLVSGKYTNINFNLDIDQNQEIRIDVSNTGNDVEDLSVDIWIKWRS